MRKQRSTIDELTVWLGDKVSVIFIGGNSVGKLFEEPFDGRLHHRGGDWASDLLARQLMLCGDFDEPIDDGVDMEQAPLDAPGVDLGNFLVVIKPREHVL